TKTTFRPHVISGNVYEEVSPWLYTRCSAGDQDNADTSDGSPIRMSILLRAPSINNHERAGRYVTKNSTMLLEASDPEGGMIRTLMFRMSSLERETIRNLIVVGVNLGNVSDKKSYVNVVYPPVHSGAHKKSSCGAAGNRGIGGHSGSSTIMLL